MWNYHSMLLVRFTSYVIDLPVFFVFVTFRGIFLIRKKPFWEKCITAFVTSFTFLVFIINLTVLGSSAEHKKQMTGSCR